MSPSEIATRSFEKRNNGYEGRIQEILDIQKKLPPQPSFQDSRPFVTLSELPPGKYVDVLARVVFLRTSERTDSLGKKMVFSGVLEDSTYKVPFISHKIGVPLSKNSVYKFQSVYAHEFEKDKSLILVATEHSKIEPRSADGIRDFVWNPKVADIKRPVSYISLQGIVTTIYSNSGKKMQKKRKKDATSAVLYFLSIGMITTSNAQTNAKILKDGDGTLESLGACTTALVRCE